MLSSFHLTSVLFWHVFTVDSRTCYKLILYLLATEQELVILFHLFYMNWCFACMYVCVRVLDPLELEIQTVVSCHVGARELNPGSLEEQPVRALDS